MIKPKKKNLFAYFKSEAFNRARVKLCAIYILQSYANGLKEDIDEDLKGFDGLFVGELKKASNDLMKAFDKYEKTYRAHIGSDGRDLGDATIDVSKAIDVQMEQSKFFLQEATKAMYKALDEQIDKRVDDKAQLEKESMEDFEIFPDSERKEALNATIKIAKQRIDELHGDVLKGVEIGFNTAVPVHRIVAKAFLSFENGKDYVDHINTIRSDNRVCNLRWVTPKENANNETTKQNKKKRKNHEHNTTKTD